MVYVQPSQIMFSEVLSINWKEHRSQVIKMKIVFKKLEIDIVNPDSVQKADIYLL